MRQQLVPALFLAAALTHALSAPLDGTQTKDNTFRDNYVTRNFYNTVLCKETVHGDDVLRPCSYYRQRGYTFDDSRNAYVGTVDRDDNYNGEGFRQEQWHNYPRQLDRLQHSPYDRNIASRVKKIFEPDPGRDNMPDSLINYLSTNGYVYDSFVASTSPMLILKIRLACLKAGRANTTLSAAARDMRARLHAYGLQEDVANEQQITDDPNVEVIPKKRGDSRNGQRIEIWSKSIFLFFLAT